MGSNKVKKGFEPKNEAKILKAITLFRAIERSPLYCYRNIEKNI